MSHASASARSPTSQPRSAAAAPAASGSGSKQTPGPVLRVGEAAADPHPVQPAADEADGARVLARQLLGGDGGRGAGAQRRHGTGVQHRQRLPGAGIGDQHDAGHRRQPSAWIDRKRSDPLQHRESLAAHRHRAEVAVRRARQVDLWRHLPLAAGEADEPVTNALDRIRGRHGRSTPSWSSTGIVAIKLSLASAEGAKHETLGGAKPRCSWYRTSFEVEHPPRSMTTNGRRRPPRPAIQVIAPAASPEQAAAIAAALERFLHDTAPTIAPRRRVAEPLGASRARRGRVPPGTESLGRPAAVGQAAQAGEADRTSLTIPEPEEKAWRQSRSSS